MTVEISKEDSDVLQRLVDAGRFDSVSEALHEGIVQIAGEDAASAEWTKQLDASIDRGLADAAAGRYRPAAILLEELDERYPALVRACPTYK